MLVRNSVGKGMGKEPVFLMPGAVSVLIVLMLAIHGVFEFGLDERGKLEVWGWFGFVPARFYDPFLPGGMLPLLWTPVTHAFLHGDWGHVGLNVAWLAIFGTPIASRYGALWFLLIFLAGALGGAGLYAALELNSNAILIGASGGVAGLTGAGMRFVFQPPRVFRDPDTGQVLAMGRDLAGYRQVWANTRSRTFILFWLGINLVVPAYNYFAGSAGTPIAWQAHIGGFFVGLVLPGLIEKIPVRSRHQDL